MTNELRHCPSHLFTLRLWQEALGEGRTEWRGQLCHVLSGQTYYFRSWQALVTQMMKLLTDLEPPGDQA